MLKEKNMNSHESLMNFIINFFLLFVSALAWRTNAIYGRLFYVEPPFL